MSFNSAHAGYAYQDLLCSFYILEEIISENDSIIRIDQKEANVDRFDDIVIKNKNGVFRKQVKYSDSKDYGHTLTKDDLASDGNYNIALHSLFKSWENYPKNERGELKVCLSWNSPDPSDTILDVLCRVDSSSFKTFDTTTYCIELDKLWEPGKRPLNSWRKFKSESSAIQRDEFSKFIQAFVIEVNLPKASLDIYSPGELERILIEQVRKLGVGEYPNKELNVQETILALTQIVTNARARAIILNTSQVLRQLRIKTDYGRIEQVFPINPSKLIETKTSIDAVEKIILENKKIIITGEPGAGKSWLIKNLESSLKNKFLFAKHYCYTDLKDELQVDRIKVNTLYGNLIAEILEHFPELKKHKNQIWASNLDELNILISHVSQNLIIIIDGLDHVQRIYDLKKNIVTQLEVDILNAIEKIDLHSDKVKIIVLSQPIPELQRFESFVRVSLPTWSEDEVLKCMNINDISNLKLSNGEKLSALLTSKSSGNPLYLSYLIEELKNAKGISLEKVNQLPVYSYNLSEYYEYILLKINEGSAVPKLFSGVNFSLTKNELVEITGLGDYIKDDLSAMLPILKLNFSTGGYSIYHESFRRFIIEKLNSNNVDIWQAIFKPIAEWLEKKGFFEFNKSSKFYFPLLYENNNWHEIAKFIHIDFIKKCLYHGHPWELIKSNFRCLALSSSYSKSLNDLIILAEQSRILFSVDADYKESFGEYFKALGAVHTFEVAANLLVLDGMPTVEKSLGLTACRICEYNGVIAPWDLYNNYRKGTYIKVEEFADYTIYLLCNKKYKNLEHIAKQINGENDYKFIFQNEIKTWISRTGDEEVLENSPTTKKLLFPKRKKISLKKITTIRDSFLGLDYIRDEVKNALKIFFEGISYLSFSANYIAIENLIKPFYSKNWFYNWIIFYAKLKIINAKKEKSIGFYFSELEEAFKYLIYDTEVFKGKIRTCDLYGIRNVIHNSIKEGLSCIYEENDRQKIIELLQNVSHRTTTTIQNSPGGPLIPSALLDILSDYDSEYQIDATIEKYEEELQSESLYRFYQSTSEYYFRLAVLYSKRGNKVTGEDCFKAGIQFLLSYTYKKDSTLGELIDSVGSLNSCSPKLGFEYIQKLKTLVDTVVNHTDGRTTKWYPIEWFEEFYKISPRESLIFLTHELFTTRHDWRLEDNLKHFLIATTGKINPLIELQIARTFPVADSKDFLKNAFDLSYKTNQEHPLLSNNSLKFFLTKLYIGRETSYSDEFLNDAESLSNLLDVTPRKSSKKKDNYSEKRNVRVEEVLKKNFHISRSEFSEMSNLDLISYCELESIPEKDSQGLYFRLKEMEWGGEKKEVISLLARKDRYVTDSNHKWVELIFQEDPKESIFFYISKFIYQHGGWFEYFVNVEDFKKAYQLNPELTIDFLFELLPPLLSRPAFTHKFSANLINSLVEVGFPAEKVINLWITLYDIIDDRLPGKSEYEWDKEIPNELREFSNEELLVILLISRIRSFSSERTHLALSGLKYLLTHSSSVLINPIKWFLKNVKDFLEINLLSVLQLLYEYKIVDEQYSLNFKIELEKIYPSNFFLIDWIIEQLIDLEAREKLMEPIVYSKPSKQFSEFFKRINLRHFNLERIGFDLDDVFGEYQNTFTKNHKDVHDLYYSRVNKLFLDNLYSPNYMLSLINKKLYNDFRGFEFFYGEEVYHLLKLKDNELTAQCFSITNRPKDLKRPLEWIASKSGEVQLVNGWVRLAFYEEENYQEEFLKDFKKFKSYGAVVFLNPEIIENEQFPFSRYIFHIDSYFNMELPDSDFDGFTTVIDIQDDMYESLRILWIAPQLFSWLKFEMLPLVNGLCAKNSDGEIVLKYNAWKEDYLGASFDEEIPKLSGSELLIREDYYNQIISYFENLTPRFNSKSFEIN